MGMYGRLMRLQPGQVRALFQAAEQPPGQGRAKLPEFKIDDKTLDAVLDQVLPLAIPHLPPKLAEILQANPEKAASLKQHPKFREAMRAALLSGGKPRQGNVRGFLESRRRGAPRAKAAAKAKRSVRSKPPRGGSELLSEMRAMDEKYRAAGVFDRLGKGALSEDDKRLLEQRNQDFLAIVARDNPRYTKAKDELEAFEGKLKAQGIFEEIRLGHTGGKVSSKHRAAFEKHKKLFAAQMQSLAPGKKDFVQAGKDPDPDLLDLDKDWHLLHYLLNGTAEGGEPPLADAILGGQEIGEDLGYGPARFLTPEKVRAVAEALGKVSAEDLLARFDPARMHAANIYGAHGPGRGTLDPRELDHLRRFFGHLVNFYRDAAQRGDAMLLYIE